MKKRKKEKVFMGVLIIIVMLLIIGIISYADFKIKDDLKDSGTDANSLISSDLLDDYEEYQQKQEPSLFDVDELKEPIIKKDLIGTWYAVLEESLSGKYKNVDSVITFNDDGTYSSTVFGMFETGTYEIENNKKVLFDNNNNEISGEVRKGSLVIFLPVVPMAVAFEKE